MDFSGKQFPKKVSRMAVRWYLAYSLSYRNIEEVIKDWSIGLDHSTVQRSVNEFASHLMSKVRQLLRRNAPHVLIMYTSSRCSWFLLHLMTVNPEYERVVTIKYLNNMIEQDHRRVKKRTNPALGYKNFNSANNTIAGIEAIAIVCKNQTTIAEFNGIKVSIADQINLLVA